MLTLAQALAFLLVAMALTITPGPDNLMVLGVGMSKGRRHGMAFGLGCALGCLSHTLLAVLGVSALLASSAVALTVLRWVGGAYLVWLGVQAWRHAGTSQLPHQPGNHPAPHAPNPNPAATVGSLFAKGLLANAINPKVALFFLSFLPQFVVVDQGHPSLQLGVLGLLFTAQAALLFGLLGFFSGAVGAWLSQRPRWGLWLDRLAGTVFVALGVRIASQV